MKPEASKTLLIALTVVTISLAVECQLKLGLSARERANCKPQQQQQSNGIAISAENKTNVQTQVGSSRLNATSESESAVKFKLDTSERLRQLRLLMQSNNYDAYLIGTNDEHGSEYVSDYDRRLRFLTGFTGSNGFALVTSDKAVLITDGRYAIQAELEADCNWSIVIAENPISDVCRWIDLELATRQQHQQQQHHHHQHHQHQQQQQQQQQQQPEMYNLKIATDARLLTLPNYDILQAHLQSSGNISPSVSLVLISQDLIDVVWNNEQTSSGPIEAFSVRVPSSEPIFIHPLQFTGNVSWQDKVARLVSSMAKLRARHYVIGKLDNIAWLLNLRGSDIPNSPLFKSYLFISRLAQVPQTITPAKQSNTQTPAANIADQVARQLQMQMQINTANQQEAQQLQSPQVLQVGAVETIRIILFVDQAKITQQVRDHLHLDGESPTTNQQAKSINNIRIQVELRDYDSFISDLGNRLSPSVIAQSTASSRPTPMQGKLLLDTNSNVAIHVLARAYDDRLILQEGLVDHLKAVKSEPEVEGMRQAHWRDSMAISMVLAKLDEDVAQKKLTGKWSEMSASRYLTHLRSLLDYNYGESFDTISAYGSNAAIIHYAPKEESASVFIGNESTYLLDTGGQYLDGTTDITRTVHFGAPSDFQRETYTRVLMGAIDCMSLIFFQPTRSPFRISDLFVRRHLMEMGLDYEHGTGHGIGAFSLVHESPNIIEHYQSVAQQRRQHSSEQNHYQQQQQQQQQQQYPTGPAIHQEPILLQPNMFSSVEPGYYKQNDFGIRLENIVVTQKIASPYQAQEQQTQNNSKPSSSSRHQRSGAPRSERQLLRFEPLSLVPFEPKLIKPELLSNRQKIWLNSYNLLVRFRMTQQIKYYLAKYNFLQQTKLKSANQTTANSNISSRLYLNIVPTGRANNKSTVNSLSNLTLDSDEFREDLERAHRWILHKTELLQLDHPASPSGFSNVRSRTNKRQIGPEAQNLTSSLLDARRLMLAYMSSLPFNDQAASEAIAALAENNNNNNNNNILSARSDQTNSSNINSAKPELSPNCQSDSISCDLSLVTKMATQTGLRNSQKQDQTNVKLAQNKANRNLSSPTELVDQDDDYAPLPNTTQEKDDSFINQLFGLDWSGQQQQQQQQFGSANHNEDRPPGAIPNAYKLSGSVGRWTLVLLATLLMLQVVLTSYAFKLHLRSRKVRCRTRTQPTSLNSSLATSMHPTGGHQHLGDRS